MAKGKSTTTKSKPQTRKSSTAKKRTASKKGAAAVSKNKALSKRRTASKSKTAAGNKAAGSKKTSAKKAPSTAVKKTKRTVRKKTSAPKRRTSKTSSLKKSSSTAKSTAAKTKAKTKASSVAKPQVKKKAKASTKEKSTGKSKNKKLAKTSASKNIKPKASSAKKGLTKTVTAKSKAVKSNAKGKVSKAKQTKTKESGVKATKTSSLTQMPVSPSMALLKPFREAATKNKKLREEKERKRNNAKSFLAKPQRKGRRYTVDLRIHTPGTLGFFSTGGVAAAPALVRLAKVKGLSIIGLTDWYNASYIDAVKETAEQSKITVIPGVDIKCKISECDEIAIIALFPETHSSAEVFRVLEELGVPSSAYGRPDYCIDLSFSEVIKIVEKNEGVIIPSRVDKTPYRHLAIPALVEEYGIHAFDLVHPDNPQFFKENWPSGGFTFFSFSNANALGQIGSRTSDLRLSNAGFQGIKELVQRR